MNESDQTNAEIISRLADVLESRRQMDADSSYVASLLNAGTKAIVAKITEESAEVVSAAAGVDDQHVIHEVADLWFHCMVLLTERGLRPEQVLAELERRFGVSGHTEKLSRASAE